MNGWLIPLVAVWAAAAGAWTILAIVIHDVGQASDAEERDEWGSSL